MIFMFHRSIMSAPVIKLNTIENVERIYEILRTESHHGFPVVDHRSDEVRIFIGFYPTYIKTIYFRLIVNLLIHFKELSYDIN